MDVLVLQICVAAALVVAIIGICSIVILLLTSQSSSESPARTKNASLLAVIGSGGHTTELLSLMEHLGGHYQPRYYIVANTDKMSEEKIKRLETSKQNQSQYHIKSIPRSREVKQSWITTVLSTLYASIYSFPIVLGIRPDIILCNGPGTCIPVCFAGIILKIFYNVKIIYVESICRVETLSLSGKILYYLADVMFVQWPQLQQKYPKTTYIGRIV